MNPPRSQAWNYLDFFIVVIGILDFIPTPQGDGGGEVATGPDVSSLRTLRVLRPLRAITKFPKLRFLIVLLLQCVPMLTNVMGLCVFIFFVFGILGVQLFQVGAHLKPGPKNSHRAMKPNSQHT
jgi:hypothetical protein